MQNTARKNFFTYSFLFGLFLLAASLPFSKFTMSLAEVIMFISWIGEGKIKEKIELFIKNRLALILSSLFILHAIGLTYTTDLHYGFEDLKKKTPLMLLPLLFSTSTPLARPMFEKVLGLFTLAVTISTLICFVVLLGFTPKQILHPQEASIFMSHIRFGLLISLSVFILGYFLFREGPLALKIFFVLHIAWLIAFLIMLESATGLVCTMAGFMVLFIRQIFIAKKAREKIAFVCILLLEVFGGLTVYRYAASRVAQHRPSAQTSLSSLTREGHIYTHDTLNMEMENSNFVWRYVCEQELEPAWNRKSKLSYSGKDLRGNDLKFTLIRFLTSRGLPKDSEGVAALSGKEQRAIEKGIANVNYMGVFNPTARLQKIIWEFDVYLKGGNPSGHSVVQRLEFWKAATEIIKQNPVFGVGTGDVKDAFQTEYARIQSPLTKEWRLRSHNQFLAIATAFGILGLILFTFTLLYPFFINRNFNNYLYLMFFVIASLSMVSEDTLESQAGVTFFAFFNSMLLFFHRPNQQTENK